MRRSADRTIGQFRVARLGRAASLLAIALVAFGVASRRGDAVAATAAPADGAGPPAEDLERAARFEADARSAAGRGATAASLAAWRRVARWDPSRVDAVAESARLADLLGRHDEAQRYALWSVQLDPGYAAHPSREATMVRRLGSQAAASGDWAAAAALLARAYPSSPPEERAEVAFEAGRASLLAGQAEDASLWMTRFESHRETAAGEPIEIWEAVLATHVAAGRGDRCAGPMARLSGAASAAREAAWSARVALATGQPLEAEQQAARAIALAPPSEPVEASLVRLWIEALDQTNQAGRVADELRRAAAARGDDPALRVALAERLADEGRTAEALAESGALAERLLRAPDPTPAEPDDKRERIAAEAASLRLRLLAGERRVDQAWELCVAVAERFGSLEPARDALAGLAEDGAAAELLGVRLATIEADDTAAGPPSAARREATLVAALSLALVADRPEDVRRFAERLVTIDATDDSLTPRGRAWLLRSVATLLGSLDHPRDAAGLAQWGLSLGRWPADDGTLHYYLARAMEAADAGDEGLRTALGAINEAIRREPRELEYALLRLEILADSDPADAAAEGERLAERFDAPGSRRGGEDRREAIARLRTLVAWILDDRADELAARGGESADEPRGVQGGAAERARALRERGDELLERNLDEFPQDPQTLNNLAYRWTERREHLHRSLRMARDAVAARPDEGSYLDTLGWCELRSGRVEDAARTLRRAVQVAERDGATADDAVLYEHLAAALRESGDPAAADDAARRAASLAGSAEGGPAAAERE